MCRVRVPKLSVEKWKSSTCQSRLRKEIPRATCSLGVQKAEIRIRLWEARAGLASVLYAGA